MSYRMKQTSFALNTTLRKPAVESEAGIVASQHRQASEIGAEVMRAGGNAADAAVAVSFALGVLEPWMSGPFGGGALMVGRAGERPEALYYGMRAPKYLDPNDYPLEAEGRASDLFPWKAVVGDRNVFGALSVAVPGTTAGIGALHARYGRMPWAELLQPAVKAAREGMMVDWYAALMIASRAEALSQDPDAAAMFLEKGIYPKGAGWTSVSDIRVNMDKMADTLAHLAAAGPEDFYRGDLARTLISDLQAKGSRMVLEDLETYAPEWQSPLEIAHNEATFFATPKLTAGPTLADMLQGLRALRPEVPQGAPQTADYLAWAEALRGAYARRLAGAGDEAPEAGQDAAKAPACTTHFAVVDGDGMMVTMTQTLLSAFGSNVVSQSTGLLFNNGIMWFDPEQGKPNSIGPSKRCLMNICPIIADKGARRIAMGAAGGRKILPAVAQVGLMLTDHGLSPDAAIHTPRIDVSGGPTVQADIDLPQETLDALGDRFDTIGVERSFFPLAFACPVGVTREAGKNAGFSETTMPWAAAVAAGPEADV